MSLVAPNNKPKYTIIVVGTGLAGASAAASLAELGIKLNPFAFKIVLEGLILSQLKEASMPLRIIKMMVTVSTGLFYEHSQRWRFSFS